MITVTEVYNERCWKETSGGIFGVCNDASYDGFGTGNGGRKRN